jgi:hypothetical protein
MFILQASLVFSKTLDGPVTFLETQKRCSNWWIQEEEEQYNFLYSIQRSDNEKPTLPAWQITSEMANAITQQTKYTMHIPIRTGYWRRVYYIFVMSMKLGSLHASAGPLKALRSKVGEVTSTCFQHKKEFPDSNIDTKIIYRSGSVASRSS